MLVLSRKKDEAIVLNENIVVTIVEIRGDKVRLGIEAPKEASVHRREVYEAIQQWQGPSLMPPASLPAPTPEPVRLTLTERQAAILGRFRQSMATEAGRPLTDAEALGALLEAAEEVREHLEPLALDALRLAAGGERP